MRKIDFVFVAVLFMVLIVSGLVVGAAKSAAETTQDPTPYVTATAPMPGDPPPSQDWLDNLATREAAFQQTKEAKFHAEPYPPPFQTPTPYAYPDTGGQTTDKFTPSVAGWWAYVWDLLNGE